MDEFDFEIDELSDDEIFSDLELKNYVDQFVRIISANSPARDPDSYPHTIKSHGKIISPYPGNLKLNGNVIKKSGDGYTDYHGYDPAPYAQYANARSRKPHYIERSVDKFKSFMTAENWEQD